jgi:O-antigen ligase
LVFGAITCFLLFDVFFDLGFVTLILDLFYGRGDYSALGNSNSVRLMQFYESLDAFVLSPLWGSGTDSAIYFMTYYTIDNFWLSLLVNFGLLGILVFLYLCLLLFSRGFLYAGEFLLYSRNI